MVLESGTGITCTLRDGSMTGDTLGGIGWGGRIIEVSIGVASLGYNGAAPIGGSMMDGRKVLVNEGRLWPLQRNNGGVCVVGATGGGGS